MCKLSFRLLFLLVLFVLVLRSIALPLVLNNVGVKAAKSNVQPAAVRVAEESTVESKYSLRQ